MSGYTVIERAVNSRILEQMNTVAYLLKARTVEPEKQPMLGNGCVTHNNGVTVGSGVFCAVRTEAI
jgi:hypothetical protein